MAKLLVLSHLHVLQNDASCYNAALHVFYTETLQVLHLEMP